MKRYDNQAVRLRKDVLIRVARALLKPDAEDALNRIPLEMRPRGKDASRCCIYKDRQVIKYRILAALGFSIEDENDELMALGAYCERARRRTRIEQTGLTVIDIACSACIKGNYTVTNACRGCLGRACQTNCRKDAIRFIDGRAVIDTERCINCGLCLQACPYHAIIKVPVPCEEACPVSAISKNRSGIETIDAAKCISCGQCLTACPFAAIQERSQMADVLQALQTKERKLTALLAPSAVGQFPGTLGQLHTALYRLGFTKVIEITNAAAQTAVIEGQEWRQRQAAGETFMTSSCCPAYAEAVKRHLPELEQHLSHTPSPMAVAAAAVKQNQPEMTTVFIGPCMAKRTEALNNADVDYVLTFEETGAILIAADIDVQICTATELPPDDQAGRGFALSGGVAKAVKEKLSDNTAALQPVCINGLDRKALVKLQQACKGRPEGNFIEVMCCEGGCVSGPAVLGTPAVSTRKLQAMNNG